MHSAGVSTQNEGTALSHLFGRGLTRVRAGGKPLVALLIALVVGRHRVRVIVAPYQTGALALLLDIPTNELGAAPDDDLRVFMAKARRHQRGAPVGPGAAWRCFQRTFDKAPSVA